MRRFTGVLLEALGLAVVACVLHVVVWSYLYAAQHDRPRQTIRQVRLELVPESVDEFSKTSSAGRR